MALLLLFFSFPEYASLLSPSNVMFSTFKYFSQVIMAEGKLLHWQLDIQKAQKLANSSKNL
jgi:hypothetical protein